MNASGMNTPGINASRTKPQGMKDPEMKPPKPIIASDVTYIRM